jgi:3-oxoadipate enol-lactonase
MPQIDLGGRCLYYERAGGGDPTLVFLHGGLIDSRVWDPQFAAFGALTDVIRLDLPGDGRSEPPRRSYSGIDDLRITLDQLEVDRAVLIGLSGGARIAIDFAIRYPSRVVKLVAAAPGLSGYNDWALPEDRVSAGTEALRAGDRRAAVQAWLELWAPVTGAALLERALDNADSLFMDAELIDLDPPAIGRLNEITAPTLVIVGHKDLADILVIADLVVEGVSNAEKHVIEGADHFPNIHDPATFNRLVADFLGLDR